MSSLDPESARRELTDIAVGVSQEWSVTAASSLVPDTSVLSLHRDFRNHEGFARNTERRNGDSARDLSGLSPSYATRGPAMVVLLTGKALDRIMESNMSGELVELTFEEQEVLDGIRTVTTLN